MAQLSGITRLMAEQLQHELQKLDPTLIMIITPKEIIYQGKTQDLQKPITSAGLQDIVEVFDHSWEDKCYRLGELLCIRSWSENTLNFLIQEVGSQKRPEISYRILAYMYDSDFEVLKQEAYCVYLEEAGDSTIPDMF
ncbi:25060_t:CDS:2 [Dentiscutata erythropus]|uniref:25060_t:CDS:1 n=1 Tax=Dentiscutata erythropus TaxID=1348616 RepID=A0A9N9J1R5_9GLOM|nr:25060_t:CDS:2 [Dentiscutata erythropus]